MSVTSDRYRTADLKAFRLVLVKWLEGLPPKGWEGTVTALESELLEINEQHRLFAYIPRRNGLGVRISSEVEFIRSSDFRVEFRRTRTERLVRFDRPAPVEGKSVPEFPSGSTRVAGLPPAETLFKADKKDTKNPCSAPVAELPAAETLPKVCGQFDAPTA